MLNFLRIFTNYLSTLFLGMVMLIYVFYILFLGKFSSVTQSCLTLRSHEPQHTRPPCPSPTPRVNPNPCPLSRWYHPTISSCLPLLLLPSIFPSIRVLSNESSLRIRWPKYWSFSFNIRPSNEHPGLISLRMDGLDLLAVQGTLKSLLQHHSSKASVLLCSAFFIVQLSHPYMTTGKTIALTRWTFFGQVMLGKLGRRKSQIEHELFGKRKVSLTISWLPFIIRLPRWHSGKESACQCRRHRIQSLGQEGPLE